jgi:hypothetical protein
MALYKHELFTIDLSKVVGIWQEEDETTVSIRTDDQRKIEVAVESPQAGVEFLARFSNLWEKSSGQLLRHGKYVFLPGAIYSIQVEGSEVYIYFRDHSVSFAVEGQQQAMDLLAELTRHWESAITTWD